MDMTPIIAIWRGEAELFEEAGNNIRAATLRYCASDLEEHLDREDLNKKEHAELERARDAIKDTDRRSKSYSR